MFKILKNGNTIKDKTFLVQKINKKEKQKVKTIKCNKQLKEKTKKELKKGEKKMKTKFKKSKGITLIALVITIIVLLILAGVSIAMLTGQNGILTQAQKAKTETENAAANEAGILSDYETKINEELGIKPEAEPGHYYEKDTDVTVGGKPVTIPGGATVSGIEEENESVDKGFVIYITKGEEITDWSNPEAIQETYDQFVWVPVEKAYVTVEEMGGDTLDNLESYISTNKVYPMAVKSGETYSGILYDFNDSADGSKVEITPYDYKTTSSHREPDVVSYDTGDYVSEGVTKSGLQSEYKEMVEGVNAKGGFWVGRYETSNMSSSSSNDSTNVIKVVKGTTNGINNVNWYRMYAQQKNYAKNKFGETGKTKSSMIWGSQWDQIMIWMKDEKNKTNGKYYITNSAGMGNFNISGVDDGYDSLANTGCFDVKNIFDLAGNVYDWTLEADGTGIRVHRRRQLRPY